MSVPKHIRSKRIVVIDDQGSMRSVFLAYLREMGFQKIATLPDGEKGLNHLEKNLADLVICDWNMPKRSGLEVLQAIRECDNTKDLPFIMVTSSSELSRVKDAVQSGVSDYLIKPFQPTNLGQKVVDLLTNSTYQPKVLKISRYFLKDLEDQTSEDDDLMVNTVIDRHPE